MFIVGKLGGIYLNNLYEKKIKNKNKSMEKLNN